MGRHRGLRWPIAVVILLGNLGLVAACLAEEYEPAPPCLPNAPDACTTINRVSLGRMVRVLPVGPLDTGADRAHGVAWEGLSQLAPRHPRVTALEMYELQPDRCPPGGCINAPAVVYLFRFAEGTPVPVVVNCASPGCFVQNLERP